jgi:hypothetical protein
LFILSLLLFHFTFFLTREILATIVILKITIIIFGFILLQIFYQIIGAIGLKLLAKEFLEPLSMTALLLFGVMYLTNTLKIKNISAKGI